MPWARALSFLAVGACLFAILAQGGMLSMVWFSGDDDLDHYRRWLARPADEVPQAVTLGSSLNRAIDLDALGRSGQQLFLAGMDLLEASTFSARYVEGVEGISLVLIPVTPDSLYQDNGQGIPAARQRTYRVLLAGGGPALIGEDVADLLVAYRGAPAHLKAAAKAQACRFLAVGCGPGREPPVLADPLLPQEVARKAARNVRIVAPPQRLPSLGPAREALVSMAERLSAKGVTLVLYEAPVSTPLREATQREYLRRGWHPPPSLAPLAATVAEGRARGLCIQLVRGLWDPQEDGRDRTLYLDPDHLNERGARLFTGRLAQRLDALPACPAVGGNPLRQPLRRPMEASRTGRRTQYAQKKRRGSGRAR